MFSVRFSAILANGFGYSLFTIVAYKNKGKYEQLHVTKGSLREVHFYLLYVMKIKVDPEKTWVKVIILDIARHPQMVR